MKPLSKEQIDEILARFPALAYKRNLLLARLGCVHNQPLQQWYLNSWADRCYVKPADRSIYRQLLQHVLTLVS